MEDDSAVIVRVRGGKTEVRVDGSLQEAALRARELIASSIDIHMLELHELEHGHELWELDDELPPSLQRLETVAVRKGSWSASALSEFLTSLKACKDTLTSLTLMDGDLSQFPKEVAHFTSLQRLCLSYSGSWERYGPMRRLPVELEHLSHLQALCLDHQDLKDVSSVWALQGLHTLSLAGSQTPAIDERIGNLSDSLTDLDICVDSGVTPSFFLLTNLTSLAIRCLQDSPIPSELEIFTKLKTFRLSWSVEEDVDTAMKRSLGMFDGTHRPPPSPFGFLAKMTSLQELDIQSRSMLSYPEGFHTLSSLRILEIPGDLYEIPHQISLLQSLESLSIAPGCLQHISDDIGKLSALRVLDIQQCVCPTIPVSIGALTQLQELSFSSSELEEIPITIGNLSNLQSLCISEAPLTVIPPSIGLLSSLRSLSITECPNVREIPREIGCLTNIETIDFSRLAVRALPDEMSNLSLLRSLVFDDTDIIALPVDMSGMTSLTKLSLTNPDRHEQSEGLFTCSSLTALNLWITTLSYSVGQLKNLTKLVIRGLSMEYLPQSLCQLSSLSHFECVDSSPFEFPPLLFQYWSSLTILRLDNAPPLPPQLGGLRHLQILKVSFALPSDLSTVGPALPDTFGSHCSLGSLEISNIYGALPESLSEVKTLGSVSFTFCLSKEIPLCWSDLQAVEFSLVDAPHLSAFPEQLLLMPQVQAMTVAIKEDADEYMFRM